MAPLSQSHINSIQKLNNIVIFRLTHPCPSVISDRWRHDISQDWEYLAKNHKKLTTAVISDETLLRLDLHISSTRYLENRASHFTKVTEHDNTSFDRKVFDDENGKKDGEETVTNSEEEASKKRAQRKSKKDAARAWALLLATVPGLSAPASASVPVSGSSTLTSTSVPMPGSFAAMPESSAALPGSFVAVLELSAAMLGLSIPASASIFVPGLSTPIPPFAPMLPKSFPLPFSTMSLPKTPMPDLAARKQRLDNTISGWNRRSKRTSSEELCGGRIKRTASKEVFLPKASLFLPLFLSSGPGKRKLDKTFINTRLLVDNHTK